MTELFEGRESRIIYNKIFILYLIGYLSVAIEGLLKIIIRLKLLLSKAFRLQRQLTKESSNFFPDPQFLFIALIHTISIYF